MACKWSALFVLLPLFILGYIKTRSKWLLGGMLLFLGTYLASYTALFLQGGTLTDFIKLQLFMLGNQQIHRLPTEFIQQLPLNFLIGYSIYYNITGQFLLVRIAEQNPFTWPLIFSSGVIGLFYFFKDRNFTHFIFNIMFWCVIIPLFFIQGFIWYLLPLLPSGLLSLMFFLKRYLDGNEKRLETNIFLAILIIVAFFALYIPIPMEILLK